MTSSLPAWTRPELLRTARFRDAGRDHRLDSMEVTPRPLSYFLPVKLASSVNRSQSQSRCSE